MLSVVRCRVASDAFMFEACPETALVNHQRTETIRVRYVVLFVCDSSNSSNNNNNTNDNAPTVHERIRRSIRKAVAQIWLQNRPKSSAKSIGGLVESFSLAVGHFQEFKKEIRHRNTLYRQKSLPFI